MFPRPAIIELDAIKRALEGLDLVQAMGEGFVAYSDGKVVVPPVGELLFERPPGDCHIKYGYIKGDEHYVIKIASSFYDNPRNGLQTSSGLMLVFSQATGALVAILLDEGHLTNVRTAAAGALCAKHLALAPVQRIGVLGTGLQARLQVRFLVPVVGTQQVVAWGRDPERLRAYKADLERDGFQVQTAATPADVARACNLIVTTTAATTPLLSAKDIRPGTHITAMGSDTPDKQELDADVLARADVVVADSIPQSRERGEICQAVKAGAIAEGKVVELGHVIAGRAPGRTGERQITVADLTGVAVQDILIAKAVYARAKAAERV